jgi:hypothetical protein
VLPESQHIPSGSPKLVIGLRVSRSVLSYLSIPVFDISLGRHEMVWTCVPEAAIDEDRNPPTCEDHVSSAPDGRNRIRVNAVPVASSVNEPPDRHLWARVSAPVALHDPPDSWRRGPRTLGQPWGDRTIGHIPYRMTRPESRARPIHLAPIPEELDPQASL